MNFGKLRMGVIAALNPPRSGGLGISIQKNHIVVAVGQVSRQISGYRRLSGSTLLSSDQNNH